MPFGVTISRLPRVLFKHRQSGRGWMVSELDGGLCLESEKSLLLGSAAWYLWAVP